VRLDVRPIGKVATFTLMIAVVWISWGNLGYALDDAALALDGSASPPGSSSTTSPRVSMSCDVRRALAEAA
jgi:hypothetical protein